MRKVINHGELCVFSGSSIPKDAKKVKGSGSYKLADSETSGNHHLLEEKEGIELFEKDGVLYLKNDVPANVYCVIKERHDTITLEPGIYEIEPAKEFDHLSQMRRNVAD